MKSSEGLEVDSRVTIWHETKQASGITKGSSSFRKAFNVTKIVSIGASTCQGELLHAQVEAARMLPKFAKFKSRGIDILPLLLRAADRCLEKVNARVDNDPAQQRGRGSAPLYFIVDGLKQVGGTEAEAKLQEIARCKNSSVGMAAKGALKATQESPVETKP